MKNYLKYTAALLLIVAAFLFFTYTRIGATAFTTLVNVGKQGWYADKQWEDAGVFYMAGSTFLSFDLPDDRTHQYDFFYIQYETASDTWRTLGTTTWTYTDDDADGMYETLAFTATGGATAGGLVHVWAIDMEGI